MGLVRCGQCPHMPQVVRVLCSAIGANGVPQARVAVTSCSGEQTVLQAEAEQMILDPRFRHPQARALRHEELGQYLPNGRIINCFSASGAAEGIVIVCTRKRMHRVPAVPVQIRLLGPWHNKPLQAVMDQRAHRVNPRPAVAADRRRERQPHPN